jgi:hypothetical protein
LPELDTDSVSAAVPALGEDTVDLLFGDRDEVLAATSHDVHVRASGAAVNDAQ